MCRVNDSTIYCILLVFGCLGPAQGNLLCRKSSAPSRHTFRIPCSFVGECLAKLSVLNDTKSPSKSKVEGLNR